MSLTDTQYLALSQLAYEEIPSTAKGEPLSTLLALDPPIFSFLTSSMIADLSSLTGWILLDSQSNSSSGFAGLAIQGPSSGPSSPGEIAFGFRGTEVGGTESLITGIQDIYSDLLLALPDAPIGQPNQFRDAYTFVKDVIEGSAGLSLTNSQLSNYITTNETLFTGHSLGGGLAQYIIYELDAGSAVTFNAVGIGQVLDISNPHYYDSMIKDYVNAGDVIGNYGTQLGQTVLLEGATSLASFDQQEVVYILSILTSISNNEMTVADAIPLLKDAFENMDSATSDYLFGGGFIDTHNISGLGSLTEYSSSVTIGPILNQVTALAIAIANSPVPNLIESLADLLTSTVALADSVTDFGSEVSNLINDTTTEVVEDVSTLVDNSITNLEAAIVAMNGDFSTIATEVGDLFLDIQQDIAGIIQNASVELASQALLAIDGFSDLFDSLNIVEASKNIALKILNGEDVTSAVYSELQTNIGSALDGLDDVADSINGIATTVAVSVAAASLAIQQEVTEHLDRIYPAIENLIVTVSGSATLFANAAAATVSNLAGDFADFGADLTGAFTDFASTFTTNLSAVGAGIGNTLSFAGELAVDTYQNVISAGGSALNNIYALVTGQNIFAVDENGTITGTSSNDSLFGFSGNNYMDGGAGDDSLDGYGGNDTIYGNTGNDIIIGGTGLDILSGDSGNDTLNGGSGNDTLRGGADNDIYIFGRGYGQDTIDDSYVTFTNPWYYQHEAGFDTISFLGGIDPDDIEVKRNGYDLIFTIIGTTDKLTVQGYFNRQADGSHFNAIEQVTFADTSQTIWSKTDILEKARYINGTSTEDYLVGYDYQDDIIITGEGNDYVSDTGTGEDYVLAGDGNDTITMGGGNGYAAGEAGDDSLHGGAGDDTLLGGNGSDTLYGDTGNDILSGGADNDTLQGSIGDDVYKFGLGYGQDTIIDSYTTFTNPWYYQHDAGFDTISFNTGINPEDIEVKRNGDDLIFTIIGTSDVLTVQGYFIRQNDGYHFNAIEQVTFADTNETIWSKADLLEKARYINGTSDVDYISGYSYQDDIINAGDGDDIISSTGDGNDYVLAGSGNDNVATGSGNDSLYGEDGDDVLSGTGGDDLIIGGAGNDTLQGDSYSSYSGLSSGNGADILNGGQGNDSLIGGAGNDTYIFGLGYGQDTISETVFVRPNYSYYQVDGGVDTISFLSGIDPEDVEVARSSNNLIFTITGTDDVLTVQSYFERQGDGSYFSAIEQVTFADTNSTVWTQTDLLEKARYINGTNLDDWIVGYENQDDIISLGDGNDTLYNAYTGNDTINAGDGNDIATGGVGNDTLNGDAGNDTLYGDDDAQHGSGNDVLDGGIGNDILYGSGGNDTYVFGLNYGQDTISDLLYAGSWGYQTPVNAGIDKISLKEGIDPEDVTLSRQSNNLILSINGTSDSLTVENYFSKDSNGNYIYAIEEIHFSDTNETIWEIADILDATRHINGTTLNDDVYGFDDQDDIINLGDGNDTLWSAFTGNDVVYAGNGNDTLTGGAGNDELYGEAGDDVLNGDHSQYYSYVTGDDLLDGGTGNDALYAGAGDDTYVFGIGYGQDVIEDRHYQYGNGAYYSGGFDKISFKEGIEPEDVKVSRSGNDLKFAIENTTDTLTVQNFFTKNYSNEHVYAIEEIQFSDSAETIWHIADLLEQSRYITGTTSNDDAYGFDDQDDIISLGNGSDTLWSAFAGNDVVHAGTGDDTITGGAGDDELYGEDGNDTINGDHSQYYSYVTGADLLDGGTGNDSLYGGAGNDTYVFGIGYGQDIIEDRHYQYGNGAYYDAGFDTISFKEGIDPEDVEVLRSGSDLVFSIIGTEDSLRVQNFFIKNYSGTNVYAIEEVKFADLNETTWEFADLLEKARYFNGTSGDDYIYGADDQDDIITAGAGNDNVYAYSGNDLLNGGLGSDTLYGGYGDDTYTLIAGDGSDTISETGGSDLVNFGYDLADVIFSQSGSDLQITVAGASDTLTITSWYTDNNYKVESIKASDDSTISSTQVEQLIQAMATYSSNNNGISWSDALTNNPQDVQNILSQYWTTPSS